MKNTSLNRRKLLMNSAKAIAASSLLAGSVSSRAVNPSHFGFPHHGTGWAAGGTASMVAPFPPPFDPFVSGLGNTCMLQPEMIVGPCYFDNITPALDISDGELGIPMGVVLKVVDANCLPIENAVVEIWWANRFGVYSGDNEGATNGTIEGEVDPDDEAGAELINTKGIIPPFITELCVQPSGDTTRDEAIESRWFRGMNTTDEHGNVYFKGCFPGWYGGRSPHIHVRVVLEDEQRLVTQLGYDDELAADIYLNHPEYSGEIQDTTNDTDYIFLEAGIDNHLFTVHRLFDGSMLTYKALQIEA